MHKARELNRPFYDSHFPATMYLSYVSCSWQRELVTLSQSVQEDYLLYHHEQCADNTEEVPNG